MWSIENLRARASVPHQETKGRGGTARVVFYCEPLGAAGLLWNFPGKEVPFCETDGVLEYGGDFVEVQQAAIDLHRKECPGHQGQHHFSLAVGFTYAS